MIRAFLVRLLAILFGVVVFVLVGEAAVRLVYNQRVSYDLEMWRYARQVKVTGLTPGVLFEHRPGAEAKLMGVEVRINEHGMRDRPYRHEKPSGTVRVAVLGDSITFGWGVEQDKTYPHLLEQRLNRSLPQGVDRVEVMNFGVGNYNTVDELAILQERVWGFAPDVILLGYFVNDVEQHRKSNSSLLRHSALAVWGWGRVDQLLRRFGYRPGYADYYNALYAEGNDAYVRMREALVGVLDDCRQRGVPVVVLLLPDLHQLAPYPFAAIHVRISDVTRQAGGEVLDLLPALPQVPPRQLWVADDDPHPNARAMQAFADFVADGLPWKNWLSGGSVIE